MKKLFILAFCFLSIISLAYAQDKAIEVDAVTQIVASISGNELNYADLNKRFSNIENILKSGQVSQSDMNSYVKELAEAQSSVQDYKKDIEQNLSYAQKKLDALGEGPAEGETEAQNISSKRLEFNSEVQDLKSKLANADIALAKIEELENVIFNTRNQELFSNMMSKQTPIVYPNVFLQSLALSLDFFIDIVRSPYVWFHDLEDEQKDHVKHNMLPVLLTVLVTILVGIFLRRYIMTKIAYPEDVENPRYATKVAMAVTVAIARGILPALIIGGFLAWIYHGGILTVGFFGLVLTRFLWMGLFIFVACALARVIYAPYYERWRIISVDSEKAKRLTSAFYFAIIAISIVNFIQGVAVSANYSQELIYLFKVASAAVKSFSIYLIIKRTYIVPQDTSTDDDDENVLISEDDILEPSTTEEKINFFAALLCGGVFLASAFGYPNLSLFILNRTIGTAITLGVFIIFWKSVKEISHRVLLSKLFFKNFKYRRKLVEKVDFWMGLLLYPILFVLAAMTVLTIWGVSTDLMLQSGKKILMGFKVGGISISLISIFMGIAAFVVSLLVVKLLQGRISKNVLGRMDIDTGIKHSLSSGFGFVGFIVAILIGIVVMGGNLSSLAIIAGALSVGIGFGLQSIVNNLVSGFILLFERPVKIGDWVIINGREGLVKQINIRATVIETWDRANVIIPNATILSSDLINMTWHDKLGRAEIKVGVAYGTDLQKVESILLDIASQHPKVTKKPAPYVVFTGFGESSLDLELRAYISDVMSRLSISSELRSEIKRRFEEARIEIPFPQQVVHDSSQNVSFLHKMAGMEGTPEGDAIKKKLCGKTSIKSKKKK
ncbi:MAG: mechanosensitive ion channel [Lactobacillus sp.]|jgi:small-conductance mechanosensitive channel|nr:mechanosensitive ion channel [Lactobacillus sp.]